MKWYEKWFGGHISIGRITIYGFNAMHCAIQVRTKRFGYICFHPSLRFLGKLASWHLREHPWSFYVSPNSTPWGATFAAGPGISREDKVESLWRKLHWGHGYSTSDHNPQNCRLVEDWRTNVELYGEDSSVVTECGPGITGCTSEA